MSLAVPERKKKYDCLFVFCCAFHDTQEDYGIIRFLSGGKVGYSLCFLGIYSWDFYFFTSFFMLVVARSESFLTGRSHSAKLNNSALEIHFYIVRTTLSVLFSCDCRAWKTEVP